MTASGPWCIGVTVSATLVRGVAERAVELPRGLVGSVIGQLVLEEHCPAPFPVPDHVVLLEVFYEEAGGSYVVAVHNEAGVGRLWRFP